MNDGITFDTFNPDDILIPLAYIEFDNTGAVQTLAANVRRVLIFGQRTAASPVAAGVPTQIFSGADADAAFGRGSMIAQLAYYAFQANTTLDVWCIALDDNGAGAKATGTITIVGTATADGTLDLYCAGIPVQVGVSIGDTPTVIAASIVTAYSDNNALPVTATSAVGVVTLTARWKGLTGNDIDNRLNYQSGDATPAGITSVTITAMTGGTANPDVTAAVDAMGDEWFTDLIWPYTDATNLGVLNILLQTRFGGLMQLDAIAYMGFRGTAAAADTFGGTLNSQCFSVMPTSIGLEAPPTWAAVTGTVAAIYLEENPAIPLQYRALPGIHAPARADRFSFDERNVNLHSGISSHLIGRDGSVAIENLITTYQTNRAGQPDTSYRQVETVATLSAIRYQIKTWFVNNYPNCILVDDASVVAEGIPVMSPTIANGVMFQLGGDFQSAGWIQDLDKFMAALVIQKNGNILAILAKPTLSGQFRQLAVKIQPLVN